VLLEGWTRGRKGLLGAVDILALTFPAYIFASLGFRGAGLDPVEWIDKLPQYLELLHDLAIFPIKAWQHCRRPRDYRLKVQDSKIGFAWWRYPSNAGSQ
jgi:hypothetical protein